MTVTPAGDAPFDVSVSTLPWVMFLQSGDALYGDDAGWWLFARAGGGACALHSACPGLEAAVHGPLRAALDGARARLLLQVADPPRALRGRAARAGWAELDRATADVLARDPTAIPLNSVNDAPNLP